MFDIRKVIPYNSPVKAAVTCRRCGGGGLITARQEETRKYRFPKHLCVLEEVMCARYVAEVTRVEYTSKMCSFTGCQFTSSQCSELENHNRREHAVLTKPKASNSQVCTFCGSTFETIQILRSHIKVIHNNEKIPVLQNLVKQQCCDLCGKDLKKWHILRNHIKVIHQQKKTPFVCPTCGKVSSRKHKIKEHMVLHTGDLS